MTDPTFTILMPIIRSPELMPFAVESIFDQTREDFELFIVCDGAPPETVRAAEAFAARDRRVRVFPFEKGEGHGEHHRHEALQQARGQYFARWPDDDLWFPDHLEEMAVLLSGFEFGNLLHANITLQETLFVGMANLADPKVRARMISEVFNFFGQSNAAYRKSAYSRISGGWSPAPKGIPSDLTMWRKFLALPDIQAGTRFVLTALHFAAPERPDWPMERRREETARYAALLKTPEGRDRLRQSAFSELAGEYVARHDYILELLHYVEVLKADISTSANRASESMALGEEQKLVLQQRCLAVEAELIAARENARLLHRDDELAHEAIARELAAIRTSLSWRITAPLRKLRRW